MAKTRKRTNYRSSITGRYIKPSTAKKHPKTSVRETDKVKSHKKPNGR